MAWPAKTPEQLDQLLASCQGRPVLVVAPHADDAALSVGGTLLRLRDHCPCTIAVVFSEERFTIDRDLAASGHDLRAVLRQELAASARLLGCATVELGLEEAAGRGLRGRAQLFPRDPAVADQRTGLLDHLVTTLRETITRLAPALLLGPLAVGRHIDHLLTRHALTLAAREQPWLAYEELPYAAHAGSLRAGLTWIKPVDRASPVVIEITPVLDEREAAAACFASQVSPHQLRRQRRFFCERTGEGDQTGPAEVLWKVTPQLKVEA